MSPFADWTAIKALSTMLRELQPDLAQSFDTKPNLLLPLAARAVGHPAIVRTITGVGWVYSSHSALALLARPVLRALNRAAAQSTAATVFEIHDDQVFFDSHHMTGKNGLVIPAGGGTYLTPRPFDQPPVKSGNVSAPCTLRQKPPVPWMCPRLEI